MAKTESILPIRKHEGKVAIVTGGASGIGEATARAFANHGARAVVIFDIQDEKGQKLAESIGLDKCNYVHCDVSDEEQVKDMIDWTVEKYGQLDIMFSNAAVTTKEEQTILDLDISKFDFLFNINVRGMAICVKHAARVMVEKHVKGTIVCSSSTSADNSRGSRTMTDYIMSKYAVLGIVRTASQQLGLHGIRVNCVSPSLVSTPIVANVGVKSPEEVQQVIGPFTCLKGNILKVEHVADAVVFLTSNDSAFVTGHNLVVDGGLISVPHDIMLPFQQKINATN